MLVNHFLCSQSLETHLEKSSQPLPAGDHKTLVWLQEAKLCKNKKQNKKNGAMGFQILSLLSTSLPFPQALILLGWVPGNGAAGKIDVD